MSNNPNETERLANAANQGRSEARDASRRKSTGEIPSKAGPSTASRRGSLAEGAPGKSTDVTKQDKIVVGGSSKASSMGGLDEERVVRGKESTDQGGVERGSKDMPPEEAGRQKWESHIEFVLSCLGFAVGLGNLWRFPYMAYSYGGGTFLIPYLLMLFLVGLPMFFLEMVVGQYSQSSATKAYGKMTPIFGFLGWAMIFQSWLISIYYICILAWDLNYLVGSFQSTLPWTECQKVEGKTTPCCKPSSNHTCPDTSLPPSVHYFVYSILGQTDDVDWSNFGPIEPHLAVGLLFSYMAVVLGLSLGIKSIGKAAWVSAILPYSILIVMFGYSVTLPGAGEGVKYYLFPDFTKLSFKVFVAAASQIIFTLSVAIGGLSTLASYNRFDHNVLRDSIIVVFGNSLTSIFCGFVVFSGLGYLAHQKGVEVSDVVAAGPSLVFIAYPEAIAQMDGAGFWAVVFFIVIFFLGYQSHVALMEAVISAFLDQFPMLRKKRIYVTLTLAAVGFFLGLPIVSANGSEMLDLVDNYVNNWCLIIVTFVEALAVGWVYGADRLLKNIEEMGMILPKWLKMFFWACWKYISPTILVVLIISNYVQHKEAGGDNPYEESVQSIGYAIVAATYAILFVPTIYLLATTKDRMSLFRSVEQQSV